MRDTFRLGKFRGVPVGLHWSLLAVVALLSYGLADNRFPADAPGHSVTAYAVAGAATAVILLVGVLLHEVGHAIVARAFGMRVDGITLSWMGGVTRIEGDATSPGRELSVAAVGPAVSLAVGGLLWLARDGAAAAGSGRLVLSALGWLAIINVAIAIFNLLPAAPLDGGRVSHAIVWALTRDRLRATRVAAGAGIALGAVMVAAGLYVAEARADIFDGLLFILFGWWVIGAARAEAQVATLHQALDGLHVGDLMRPVGVAPGWVTTQAFLDSYTAARPGWVWLLEAWGPDVPGHNPYSSVVAGDALTVIPPAQRTFVRPADVAVAIDALGATTPGEPLIDALTRTGGRQILLAVADGHTVGALLPADVEAYLRVGRRPQAAPPQPTPGRATPVTHV